MSAETPDTQPPPPQPPVTAEPDKAGRGKRALAVLLALVLAFATAVMILVAVEIGDSTICEEFPLLTPAEQIEQDNECFDGSSGQKTASVILAWASGAAGVVAVLLALAFAVTGRRGRPVLTATGAAVLFGVLSILVGSL